MKLIQDLGIKNFGNYKKRFGLYGKSVCIGTFKTAEEAGYAYDKYVIDNNLEHNTNGLYKKEISCLIN